MTEHGPHLPDVPASAHAAIALKEENCTSCLLCVRECPDWCITLDFHKETEPAQGPGGRERWVKVLDRFAIDWSVCMYCGICVDVCPFDALFWSPEHRYPGAGQDPLGALLHEKERLAQFLPSVPGKHGSAPAPAGDVPAPAPAAPVEPEPVRRANPFATVRPRRR